MKNLYNFSDDFTPKVRTRFDNNNNFRKPNIRINETSKEKREKSE